MIFSLICLCRLLVPVNESFCKLLFVADLLDRAEADSIWLFKLDLLDLLLFELEDIDDDAADIDDASDKNDNGTVSQKQKNI